MEKEIKSCELPKYAKAVMSYIHKVIGVNNFILYGGAPIDLMRNRNCRINDYDLAISGKTQKKIKKVIDSLIDNSFKITESNRKYYIYHDIEVILVYAKNDKISLDICFMDNVQIVGQFNIESLYWKYPEMKYVDKYNALNFIDNKNIIPIRGLKNENAFLLISRFIYLCSKYDISLFNDGGNCIDLLNKRLQKYGNDKSEQVLSCLSSIFKSILRAKNKEIFIKELVNSGLIKKTFSLLHISLNNLSRDKHNYKLIARINDKKELLLFLKKYLERKDRHIFMERAKILSKRKWDKQDLNIA